MNNAWKLVLCYTPLHWIDNRMKDKECKVMEEMIIQWMLKKLLVGVVGEVERRPTNQNRMKELAKVN